VNAPLAYAGGATVAAWGIAHLFPTPKVVAGFGTISGDNRQIITMEWIVEGVALCLIGALVILATAFDLQARAIRVVDGASAGGLVVLALVSLFTGFKVKLAPFKLCPLIFTASAALILAGALA
jgi:hypothetical protein